MPQHFTNASQSIFPVSQFTIMQHFNLPKLLRRNDYTCKSGDAAVQLQIIINRKRKVYSTKIRVRVSEWDPDKELVKLPKHRKTEENQYNMYLQQLKNRACSIIQNFIQNDIKLSIEKFDYEFSRAEVHKSFLKFMEQTTNEEVGYLSKETIKVRRTVIKKLYLFRDEINFSDLTIELISSLEIHMLKKWKLGTNTRYKYHKTIKRFINLAIEHGINIKSPYCYFHVKKKTTNRDWHTTPELHKLIALYNSNKLENYLQQTLAAYLFSCLGGGYRISDLLELTSDNIINGQIVFQAEKTKRYKGVSRITLPEIVLGIIEGKEGKLFNITSHRANINLKKIMWIADINKVMTFHMARHTFAMQYLINGGKIEHLQKILGHSKIETTMVYVHMHDDMVNQKMEIMNNIITSPRKMNGAIGQLNAPKPHQKKDHVL